MRITSVPPPLPCSFRPQENAMKRCALLLASLFIFPPTVALGHSVPIRRPVPPRPPVLIVKVDTKAQPLKVNAVDVDVRIHGHLAETRMTTTFYNPHHRVLEGDLYFPLPHNHPPHCRVPLRPSLVPP